MPLAPTPPGPATGPVAIRPIRDAPPRAPAILLAAAAALPCVVGCANDDPHARAAVMALDGTYSGTLTPAGGAPGCSTDPKPLRIRIDDGRVEVEGHGRSRTLSGIVDADGQLSTQNGKDDRVLTGTVASGHFTGFMTTPPSNAFDGGLGEQGRSCILEAVAQRRERPGG